MILITFIPEVSSCPSIIASRDKQMMVSRIVMKMVLDPKYMEKSWRRKTSIPMQSSVPTGCLLTRGWREAAAAGESHICILGASFAFDCSYRDDTADKQDGGDNKTELKYSLLNVVFAPYEHESHCNIKVLEAKFHSENRLTLFPFVNCHLERLSLPTKYTTVIPPC